jgi:hypothetical protein
VFSIHILEMTTFVPRWWCGVSLGLVEHENTNWWENEGTSGRFMLHQEEFDCGHVRGWMVLVVEPDYLLDSEVFYFQPCLYPMKYLHPRSMYTLPCGGVQRGGTPSAGSGGAIPPAGESGGKRAPSGGSGSCFSNNWYQSER